MAGPPILLDAERLDGVRGRSDARELLRVHLASAPPEYVTGALDNPDFGPEELVLVLGNRGVTAEILTRIARHRPWMRTRAGKLGLVTHPKTPYAVSRGYLAHLCWKELAEVAANLALTPVLRREAEKLVRVRLPELSVGERISLARLASRGLVEILREETETQVLQALAGNPRATEGDLARVIARSEPPPAFLAWLAEQSAWGQRRAIRLALVRHPRMPAAAALRLARSLAKHDLEALARDATAPPLLRVAAARRSGVDSDSGASLESPADRRHPGSRGLPASR